MPTRIRHRVAGRLRGGARRLRALSPVGRGHVGVSVILPIYNVEEYLAECLDSLAAQTFTDYEVIVVDDGSPDGSRAIAERYAADDPRIRVVTRENGGLGAARNTGITEAKGRFLTFVDSDDLLPPQALQLLVDSATATGSDIVVGAVERFDKSRVWRPGWVDGVHLVTRPSVTVQEFLPVIRNLYTWDKLFRHDFWKAQGLWFREGVAYEDQPIVTQLFARARGIDVLSDVVYRYRMREDRSSISQQTASVSDLRDRIAAWDISREVLLREVPRPVYDGWLLTLFYAHFQWYLTSPGTVDDTYWKLLQAAVVELTEDAPQAVWNATEPEKRVLIELTRQDRRADAQELVRLESNRPERWESTPVEGGIVLRLPFFGDPDLADDLFLIRREQLSLAHSIENIHWLADRPGTCSISGWAFIRKLDLARYDATTSVVLRNAGTGAERVFASSGRSEPAFAPPDEDRWCDYEPGTFHVDVPLAEVLADDPVGSLSDAVDPVDGDDRAVWEVLLRVEAAGFTVTQPVTSLVRSGSAGVVAAATFPDGDRLVAGWRVHHPLVFRRVPRTVEVSDPGLTGRTLAGVLEGPAVSEVRALVVSAETDRVEVEPADAGTGPGSGRRPFRVELPVCARLSAQHPVQWDVTVLMADGRSAALTVRDEPDPWRQDPDRPGDGALELQRTRNGTLAVAEWTVGAVAEALAVSGDGLRIAGRVLGSGVRSVALSRRHLKSSSVGDRVEVTDGRFEADLRLQHELYRFGARPLPTGHHDLSLLVHRDGAEALEVPLKMSRSLNGDLPVPVHTPRSEGRVVRGPQGVVRLSLVRPIGDARGLYHQQRLKTARRRTGGLTRGVLMRSYFGESATDNGLSIQKELARRGSDLPVYWAVHDYAVPVPDGGIPVVVNSREWYDLLSSVHYYVDNMYQPEYHQKPEGQVVVQTFHGYPFKLMGHPHWRNVQFSQARIDAYDARAREWDYLVSPARYATELLRRDFAYPGEVLEIGYPRNDVLQSPEADQIREQTRRSLGVADGRLAVLYAPTFRDYLAQNDNRATMADFLDFERATRALGPDVVILVRGHAFNARSARRVGELAGIVDVTDYPEVSDLYLAADAAIVDYSSLRFDFGVTGKPMIFHVPDLQRYKDTRGWLFDFEPTAPGPLVDTTDEVVEQLQDLEGVRTRYASAYESFRTAYLDLEDGHAGQRFVDAVFSPRGDA